MHVVTIGTGEVIIIADHGLILFTLEENIYTSGDVCSRETTLDAWTCLGHVAYGGSWLLSNDEFANHLVDSGKTDGQRAVAEIGEAGIQRILLGDLATPYLVEQTFALEDSFPFLRVVGHVVDREDVHVNTDFKALCFIFNHQCASIDDFRKRVIIVGLAVGINSLENAIRILIFLQEPLVVGSGHIDVDIIVPGNVALMADGSNEGSAGEEIAQMLLFTELMYIVENSHLDIS